jgi:hypothetical protein
VTQRYPNDFQEENISSGRIQFFYFHQEMDDWKSGFQLRQPLFQEEQVKDQFDRKS